MECINTPNLQSSHLGRGVTRGWAGEFKGNKLLSL